MDATEVVTEVPQALKKLLKYVMRAFYTPEETLIMDLLLRNACMKEEDVVELLKLDKKQMGIAIKRLKNDQFIKTRMKVEVDNEGKTTKHNYYFIHYTGFVNVVKYKLDHVRRKLEVQERDSTSRASFKCSVCQKTYTDLEADRLISLETGTFNCMMCGCEIEEEQSSAPVKDARALVAKFNEQIEELFNLLRDCDKLPKLSNVILEPDPIDIRQLGLDRKSGQRPGERPHNSQAGPRVWSGDATRNVEFGLQQNAIDVRIGDSQSKNQPTIIKKEQPEWMQKSTVDGVKTTFLSTQTHQVATSSQAASTSNNTNTDSSIMNALLVHENKPSTSAATAALGAAAAAEESDDSDLEEAPPASGVETLEESEEEEVMVSVGSRKVPFHEAAELVSQMTDEQREAYNKLAQSLYADLYD